ncbi:hypothetical protein [Aurantiacibacter gangjinensis]|uniref:Uncharacterized protein n=1 Tax=Aurantiacibacter gangjinensis TaxID=502682 RepID=A0A0G9MLD0_9SPHN|nr:hypothetical protein [Aurantiacibacter gangjinensis]APE27326.1 Serine kinase of the HPr protein, regulates carbohydrate metabolism [Aurantiacibacter gangjinensis]KLE31424.1 hypothetical protein AAW01_07465 [Aurantiacibacter gangjinensis]
MTYCIEIASPRAQIALQGRPYDRWITPSGAVMAEFYRENDAIRIRFAEQADVLVRAGIATCYPAEGVLQDDLETLVANSLRPLLANHSGDLNLHGSACATPFGALAFVGQSRLGKTTLAAACARAGHPFLAEDTIALEKQDGTYLVLPQRPIMRLFADSAQHLGLTTDGARASDDKRTVHASAKLPFAGGPAPLAAIMVLGPGDATAPIFQPLDPQPGLAEIMSQAFVLDVEDKPRLRSHFGRLTDLALAVPFIALDYPRNYAILPEVVAALVDRIAEMQGS